jgi:hypothetical protein
MIHTFQFNGVPVKSGDILFTRDGEEGSLFGEFWRLIGRAFPSEFSHCAIYLGPGVRFVESAAKGVVVVEMEGDEWDGLKYGTERLLVDELVGIGDPLAGRNLSPERETAMREAAIDFCLKQAAEAKPYNLDFFNPESDSAFYCSQLAYKAYEEQGIDFSAATAKTSQLGRVVLPEELWDACNVKHRVQAAEPKSDVPTQP